MKILTTTSDLNLNISNEQDFKTNLGWHESFQEYEDKTLREIINPIENYETIRFIHEPYVSTSGLSQCDIWFKFYFIDGANTYANGLDYNLVGITDQQNALMLKASTKSFFKLEFFSTPNRRDQKLLFSKSLSLPLGEKVYLSELFDFIHVPVFTGNNYRNSENMYFFWFSDATVYTGDTFYMSARFFNAGDGSVTTFANNSSVNNDLVDQNDLFYQVVIDRTNFTYVVNEYNGLAGSRKGLKDTPINFYEIKQ